MHGKDEREGGALPFFNLPQPLALAGSSWRIPRQQSSPLKHGYPGVWIDIEKPFGGMCRSGWRVGNGFIGLANNHMCRDQTYENEAWGRPRDAQRLPPPRNGF
jgi:hypothetical protein